MTEEQSRAAFCVPEDEPWFIALLARIDDHILDAQLIVAAPATSQHHGILASAAGRLDALLTFREDIAAFRRDCFAPPKE